MISRSLSESIIDESASASRTAWNVATWLASLLILGAIGWTWPYNLSSVSERLNDTDWIFSWLTALVLLGAAAGYLLRSRWSVLVVVAGLYSGGLIRWLQDAHGFRWPAWEAFLPVSSIALGALLVTAGLAAGIACRVLEAESSADGRTGSVQLAAAVAGLMGLLAFTAINVLPLPYIGGLLGLAALLAGVTVMQESGATGREHLLATTGMIFGVIAAGTQAVELWQIVRSL